MGDSFKRQIFDDQMQDKIQGWAMSAKGRRKLGSEGMSSSIFKDSLPRRTKEAQIVSESAPASQYSVDVLEDVAPVEEISDI